MSPLMEASANGGAAIGAQLHSGENSAANDTPEGAARPSSPSQYDRGHFRKKRKTLACYDCRRRKLKCDREYPACTRCVKGGHPETCHYEDTLSENGDKHEPAHSTTGDPSRTVNGVSSTYTRPMSPASRLASGLAEQVAVTVAQQQATIAQLQNKVSSLEAKVIGLHFQDFNNIRAAKSEAVMNDAQGEAQGNAELDPAKEAYHEVEPFHVRGKGYKTKFYGASDVQVLLIQFKELQNYIKDLLITNPRLQTVQNQAKHLRKSVKENRMRPNYTGSNLMRLMPPREVSDMLINLYLNTIAMIYPIMHKPSFKEKYEALWTDPSSAKDEFVAKVILAMTSVRCAVAHPSERVTFIGLTSSLKKQAIHWVGEIEVWLEKRSNKHAARSDFQVKCLLLIAKLSCQLKVKRSFTEAGTLIRWGMSAGLHRNHAVRSKALTAFDLEMRQRIWTFMKIWDLQQCIERGMPIWPGELPDNDEPPLNIDDSMLHKPAATLPPSRPRNEFTDSSFLRISAECLVLRSGVGLLVNTARSYVDYSEVLAYDAKIMERIHDLPKWIDEDTSEEERLRRALPQFLAETQLRQCQLMLHRPYMRVAMTNPRYSYSRTVCMDASATMLDHLLALPQEVRDVVVGMSPDFYRASFIICHSLYVSSLTRTDTLFNSTRESLSALVLMTLRVVEEKVLRSGNGMDQHWLLQAAYYFLRTRKSPSRGAEYIQAMIDRVSEVHDRIASTQNYELADPAEPSSVTGTMETLDGGSSLAATPDLASGAAALGAAGQLADNLYLFDFLELPDLSPDMLTWDTGMDKSAQDFGVQG